MANQNTFSNSIYNSGKSYAESVAKEPMLKQFANKADKTHLSASVERKTPNGGTYRGEGKSSIRNSVSQTLKPSAYSGSGKKDMTASASKVQSKNGKGNFSGVSGNTLSKNGTSRSYNGTSKSASNKKMSAVNSATKSSSTVQKKKGK